MSNPIDECLAMRKQALGMNNVLGPGFGQSVTTAMREGAAQGLGQGAVGLAATGIGVAALKAYRAIRKRSDFKGMLEANPDLQEHLQSDPATFNRHYNSLRVLMPGYAEDPVISGGLMRSMSNNPGGAAMMLMDRHEAYSKSRPQGGQFSLTSKISPDRENPGETLQETGSSYRF